MRMRTLSGAPVAMQKKGIETDAAVLQIVLARPGIAVHEIADSLGWTNGKVDGSVNRLSEKGRVRIEHFLRRKALIKKIYPAESKRERSGLIEIPKEEIVESIWKNTIYVYALSRSSIAVSPTKSREWEDKALWKGAIRAEGDGAKLQVRLPEPLSSFYRLENSEISLSTSDDFVLVNIESTVVPVELPPSHPETHILRKTRCIVLYERIEQVGVASPIQDAAFYGKYVMGKGKSISKAVSSEADIHTLSARKKKDRSSTSQETETQIPVIVR
jgi:predicted transcriptional regulator